MKHIESQLDVDQQIVRQQALMGSISVQDFHNALKKAFINNGKTEYSAKILSARVVNWLKNQIRQELNLSDDRIPSSLVRQWIENPELLHDRKHVSNLLITVIIAALNELTREDKVE